MHTYGGGRATRLSRVARRVGVSLIRDHSEYNVVIPRHPNAFLSIRTETRANRTNAKRKCFFSSSRGPSRPTNRESLFGHAATARDVATGDEGVDPVLFLPTLKWWNFSSASYPRTTLISTDPPATTTNTVSSGARRSTA